MPKIYRDLDLAELKSELRNAYTRKVLEVQIKEKKVEAEITKIREDFDSKLEKLKRVNLNESMKKQKLEISRRKDEYKKELEDQMNEKERVKKVEEEEAKKERKRLQESDRMFEEEEMKEKLRTRKELAERLQREKIIFQEIKKIKQRMAKEAEKKMSKENEKYAEEMIKRSKELEMLQKEQKRRREELINTVARSLVNFRSKKFEREEQIAEFLAEEAAWDIVIQEREDELRRKKMVQKLVEGLKEQIRFSQERARKEAERDREFSENVIRRVMEDERIEKLTNEAKMRSRILYKEDLMRLMKERQKIRQMELERIEMEFENEKIAEEARRIEIQEARSKLLIEHVENVGPYVKDEMLTDEERTIVAKTLKN